MSEARARLQAAIKAYDNERYYNGHIPSWVTELVDAATAYMNTKPTILDIFPPSKWEVEVDIEGGQPNGVGEIEPNSAREWFYSENETHHREVYYIYGKWESGPTPDEAARRERVAVAKARRAAEIAEQKERNRPSEEEEILRKAQEILERRKEAGQ